MNKSVLFSIGLLSIIFFYACNQKKQDNNQAVTIKECGVSLEHSKIYWRGFEAIDIEEFENEGELNIEKGTISIQDGAIKKGELTIHSDALSLSTEEMGDEVKNTIVEDLKSEAFLDVAKYPVITIKFDHTKCIEGEYNTQFTGEINYKNTLKKVNFKANISEEKGQLKMKSEEIQLASDFSIQLDILTTK